MHLPAYHAVILTAAKERLISGFGVTQVYSFRVLSHPLSHVSLTIKQSEKKRKCGGNIMLKLEEIWGQV